MKFKFDSTSSNLELLLLLCFVLLILLNFTGLAASFTFSEIASQVFTGITLALGTGLIWYYIQVVHPHKKNMKVKLPSLVPKLRQCCSQPKVFLDTLYKYRFDTQNTHKLEEAAHQIFTSVGPYDDAPLTFGLNNRANVLQYLSYFRKRVLNLVEEIKEFEDILDPEIEVMLINLKQHSLLAQISMVQSTPINNKNISWLLNCFLNFSKLMESLEHYIDRRGW